MTSDPDKLIAKHPDLTHSENRKVTSHVQRQSGDWLQNTVLIEGTDVPFKYKRKKRYKDITGRRVNLTYYPATESVAGIEMEVMRVVRIRIA